MTHKTPDQPPFTPDEIARAAEAYNKQHIQPLIDRLIEANAQVLRRMNEELLVFGATAAVLKADGTLEPVELRAQHADEARTNPPKSLLGD